MLKSFKVSINGWLKLFLKIFLWHNLYHLIISSAWSSGSHSIQLLYHYSIFSKYSPQTSQNQYLEEASIGLCVGGTS